MAVNYQVGIARKAFARDGTDQLIISDFILHLEAGEFVTLLGPSGAGKSTLLNIMAGLDSDFSGTVTLLNADNQPARVSLMFQEPRLMPWLTICENIMLVCEGSKTQRKAIALHWLKEVGLQGTEQQYPTQLSGGMLKRAALARAFAYEPDILLMDEPFSSLDMPAADALRDLLTTLWQNRHLTIVYVTHDIQEALKLSDRVLLLKKQPMQLAEEVKLDYHRPRNVTHPPLLTLAERFKQALTDPA